MQAPERHVLCNCAIPFLQQFPTVHCVRKVRKSFDEAESSSKVCAVLEDLHNLDGVERIVVQNGILGNTCTKTSFTGTNKYSVIYSKFSSVPFMFSRIITNCVSSNKHSKSLQ